MWQECTAPSAATAYRRHARVHSILESTSSLRSSSRRESENMYTVGEGVAGQEVSSTAAVRRAEIVLPRLVAIAAYCRGMHPTRIIRRGSPSRALTFPHAALAANQCSITRRLRLSRSDTGTCALPGITLALPLAVWPPLPHQSMQCQSQLQLQSDAVSHSVHEFTRTHAKREFRNAVIKTVFLSGESVVRTRL